MARPPRTRPEIEETVVPPLSPAPEALVGNAAAGVAPAQANGQATTGAAPVAPPAAENTQPPPAEASPPAPASPPTASAETASANQGARQQSVAARSDVESHNGEQARDTANGSGVLELRDNGPVDRQPDLPASGGFAGSAASIFQAVQLNSEDDLLEVRDAGQQRGRHLGFRVTNEYLESFKANTYLVAALNRVSVEVVNTVILNEMMKLFPTINEVIRRHKEEQASRR